MWKSGIFLWNQFSRAMPPITKPTEMSELWWVCYLYKKYECFYFTDDKLYSFIIL